MEDTQINLMGLNSGQQIFLTQEDQEAHTLGQFQMQSGEPFDFKEGYDTTVYAVHKQYNLRSRRVDISDDNKQKSIKQPTKTKLKDSHIQTTPEPISNPNTLIVEDVSAKQKSDQHPPPIFPLEKIIEETLENGVKVTSTHNNIPMKESVTENSTEKDNLAA